MTKRGFSVSKIKTFLKCEELYRLKYIEKAKPPFTPSPLAFGSAVHQTLDDYNKLQGNMSPGKYFESEFNDIIFKNKEKGEPVEWDEWSNYQEDVKRGTEICEKYLGKNDVYLRETVYSEVSFAVEIPGLDDIYLHGIIDGIVDVEDLLPLEYKTTKEAPEEWFLENDIQLLLYCYAIWKGRPITDLESAETDRDLTHLFGKLPKRIKYVALNSLYSKKKPWHVSKQDFYCYPTEDKMLWLEEYLRGVLKRMLAVEQINSFIKLAPEVGGICKRCQFRKRCWGE